MKKFLFMSFVALFVAIGSVEAKPPKRPFERPNWTGLENESKNLKKYKKTKQVPSWSKICQYGNNSPKGRKRG